MSEPDNVPLIDLLALLAYGQLEAFDRMSADARLAPDLRRRAALSEMAAAEIGTYRRLIRRLAQLGGDPYHAMAPFVAAIEAYHAETQPKDWLEALVKAYVGDGISDDFYGEVAAQLSGDDRDLIMDVLHEGLGNPKYAPCPLLRQYVAAGRLGRKSGRGFYEYA